jgi:hypothetical protein
MDLETSVYNNGFVVETVVFCSVGGKVDRRETVMDPVRECSVDRRLGGSCTEI